MIMIVIKGLVSKTIAIKYKHGNQNTFQSKLETLYPSWKFQHTRITMGNSTVFSLKKKKVNF